MSGKRSVNVSLSFIYRTISLISRAKEKVCLFGGIIIIAMLLCFFSFSCKNPAGNNQDIDKIKSDLPREIHPTLSAGELEELVEGNTQFACDFYNRIRNDKDNIFISPHSISVALAMAYAGARGNTQQQMAHTLHFTLDQERLHNAFNALDLELAKRPQAVEKDGFKLNICNAAWGQKGFPFLQDYLDVLALNYGSGLMLLDFIADPEKCRLTINDWVSEQTEKRIEDLLPAGTITPATTLVLTNAIYFKAGWLYPFNKDYTCDAPFYTLDGQEVTVPLMFTIEEFGYAGEKDYYQAVELLYKGKEVSMVILLPAAGRFEDFEAALNADFLGQIIGKLSAREVQLKMPRFSFEWKDSLSDYLKALGMTDAFEPGSADFSGIDGALDLFISHVIHRSFVAVDEAGTEAAAATAVVIDYTSAPDTISMVIDRPFIFLVRDRVTGAVLFLGRVLHPSA